MMKKLPSPSGQAVRSSRPVKPSGQAVRSSRPVKPEDVASLSLEEFVQILQENGGESASVTEIRKQITDGAPTNEDGTIDLIRYAVWLLKAKS